MRMGTYRSKKQRVLAACPRPHSGEKRAEKTIHNAFEIYAIIVSKPVGFGPLRTLFLSLMTTLIVWQSAGQTLHRSFRLREVGFCFGAGRETVSYPVDTKVAMTLDEAAEKDAAKANKQVPIGGYVSNPNEWRKDKREM